jgi:hypothetical protein
MDIELFQPEPVAEFYKKNIVHSIVIVASYHPVIKEIAKIIEIIQCSGRSAAIPGLAPDKIYRGTW